MILPDEFKLEELIKEKDSVQIYRGTHSIYGDVRVYILKSDLTPEDKYVASRSLFNYGRQLREHTLLNIPHTVKTLETSGNPEEPFIVTEYLPYDLDDFGDGKDRFKPARVFNITSRLLDALICLLENDLVVDRMEPDQILMPSLDSDDIRLSFATRDIRKPVSCPHKSTSAFLPNTDQSDENDISDETKTLEQTVTIEQTEYDKTVTLSESTCPIQGPNTEKIAPRRSSQYQIVQRNVYLVARIAYKLITGVDYDRKSISWPKHIPKRYREILNAALSRTPEKTFHSYSAMRNAVQKANNFKFRIVCYLSPLFLGLLVLFAYYGHNEYLRWKIKHSDASLAVDMFLQAIENVRPIQPNIPDKLDISSIIHVNEDEIYEPFLKIEEYDVNESIAPIP